MDISTAIHCLEEASPDPREGLPQELFLFLSSRTPLVNVDLLIQDQDHRTLLAWRDDFYSGRGWHVPGGILRSMEPFDRRIRKVAELEIGARVEYDPKPISVREILSPQYKHRNHFISFLYRCHIDRAFIPQNPGLGPGDAGFLAWHAGCPGNLIECQEIYRDFM